MTSAVQSGADRLCRNVERVLVGKRSTIQLAIVALLCKGHLLIEDEPGIGKTTPPRAMAQSIGGRSADCSAHRIYSPPT